MSSSPYKKYHTSEIIKDHLQKLQLRKDQNQIKPHELAQITQLEEELKNVEHREQNKHPSNFPKG